MMFLESWGPPAYNVSLFNTSFCRELFEATSWLTAYRCHGILAPLPDRTENRKYERPLTWPKWR